PDNRSRPGRTMAVQRAADCVRFVRRTDAVRDATTEATRGRKRQAEPDRGRRRARQGNASGHHQAKVIGPARRRELVDHLRATWQVSIWRACSVLKAERSSYQYKGRRRPRAALVKRIKEIAET